MSSLTKAETTVKGALGRGENVLSALEAVENLLTNIYYVWTVQWTLGDCSGGLHWGTALGDCSGHWGKRRECKSTYEAAEM